MLSVVFSFVTFNKEEYIDITLTLHILNVVLQNHEILDSNRYWSEITFLEA